MNQTPRFTDMAPGGNQRAARRFLLFQEPQILSPMIIPRPLPSRNLIIQFDPKRCPIEPIHTNHRKHIRTYTNSNKHQQEPRTESRRLAGIHRRQAIQTKTRTNIHL